MCVTSKWDRPYQVFDTPSFPARWKVGRFEDDDNGTCNYFVNRCDAVAEADKRNRARHRQLTNKQEAKQCNH